MTPDAARRELEAQLRRLLIARCAQMIRAEAEAIRREYAATIAAVLLEDLGEPDCPICAANARRVAMTGR